jgi:hypothetical protein
MAALWREPLSPGCPAHAPEWPQPYGRLSGPRPAGRRHIGQGQGSIPTPAMFTLQQSGDGDTFRLWMTNLPTNVSDGPSSSGALLDNHKLSVARRSEAIAFIDEPSGLG